MVFKKRYLLFLLITVSCGLCLAGDLKLVNPMLDSDTDDQDAPNGWQCWSETQMAVERTYTLSESAAWKMWYDSGIWQAITTRVKPGSKLKFGGYFQTPSSDPLRNGAKHGRIALEFYDAREIGNMIGKVLASPTVNEASRRDNWLKSEAIAIVPEKTRRIQFVVTCENGDTGDGCFFVDDLFLKKLR